MSNHPIVHIEISANDRVAGAKFYQDVFGWEFQQAPEMNYATFMSQKDLGGGLNPVTAENPAGRVVVYIGTDDIEASMADIKADGGKPLGKKKEIPSMGWFAYFQDPTGNTLALFKEMPQTA